MKMEELFEWVSTYSTQRKKSRPFADLVKIVYFLHCDYAYKSQTMLTSDMDFEIDNNQIISKKAPREMKCNLHNIDYAYDCSFAILEKEFLQKSLDKYLGLTDLDLRAIFKSTSAFRVWSVWESPYKIQKCDIMNDSIQYQERMSFNGGMNE